MRRIPIGLRYSYIADYCRGAKPEGGRENPLDRSQFGIISEEGLGG